MDTIEAKALLAAYRAGELDADDPAMTEALKLLESQPELANWFKNENAFDEAFADKLNNIQPPPDLKAKLLALDPEAAATPGEDKVVTLSDRRWWQRSSVLSIAATIVILLGFAMMFLDPTELQASPELSPYLDEVSKNHRSGPKLDKALTDLDAIRAELAAKQHPVPGELPQKIDDLLEIGYGHFDYKGYPVSVIHMSDGDSYHLYLIDRACFQGQVHLDAPQVMASNHVALMTWTDDHYLYVLILDGSANELQDLL